MRIRTRKFKDRRVSKVIREATKFYLCQVIPSKHLKRINVDVVQTSNTFADGSCCYIEKYQYNIELGEHLDYDHKLLTLAHETVHIKQYVTRQLKSFFVKDNPVDVWEGKRYRNLSYDDQPWEKEAMEVEQDLYNAFVLNEYAKHD